MLPPASDGYTAWVFCLRRPSTTTLERYLLDCESRELNVPGLNVASLEAPPPGFVSDTYGGVLGSGRDAYEAAVEALESFAMYPSPWTWVHARPGPLEVGSVYVGVVRGFGLYTLLPGRVLEVFDGSDPMRRRGFTFGTLAGHVEQGAERFEVHRSSETDEVRYGARAVSRPTPLVRLGKPFARRLQLRFQRESTEAMRAHVQRAGALGRQGQGRSHSSDGRGA